MPDALLGLRVLIFVSLPFSVFTAGKNPRCLLGSVPVCSSSEVVSNPPSPPFVVGLAFSLTRQGSSEELSFNSQGAALIFNLKENHGERNKNVSFKNTHLRATSVSPSSDNSSEWIGSGC